MKRKTMRTVGKLVASASMLGLLACADIGEPLPEDDTQSEDIAPDEATETEEPALRDGEERFGDGVTPIADVRVEDSRFIFVQIAGPDGQPAGVATIHQISPNTPDPNQDPRLSSASPLDLFLAITPEGTDVPEELHRYGDERLGERGWFLDELSSAERIVPRAACNNNDFRAALRNWRPEINDGEFWRLNTSVGVGGSWTGPVCGTALPCSSPSFYSLYNNANSYSLFEVDEMKQRIAICAMNPSRTVCSTLGGCNTHLGPTVRFQYRTENNASTGQVFRKLRWPSSIPFLFASLKVAIAISLVGAIVGELPTGASAGIGARLLVGSYYGQTVQIWAALLTAAAMAGLLVAAVGGIERLVLRRSGARP